MNLGEYIAGLIDRLTGADPSAAVRLRTWVGDRRARITVDEEVVEVSFEPTGNLVVQQGDTATEVDGTGKTTRRVVLALLAAHLEVTDALLDGDIELSGDPDAIVAILAAIEILIDVSTRAPSLRELASLYERDSAALAVVLPGGPVPARRQTGWLPVRPANNDGALGHDSAAHLR
jgi:hypothetical protein